MKSLLCLVGAILIFPCAAWGQAAKNDRTPWYLKPVIRPAVPGTSANPIDSFLSAQHQKKGLKPVGPADRLTLLRRAHLDLTGIPPTIAEQDAFLADTSHDAYEKVIDRLLASEQ